MSPGPRHRWLLGWLLLAAAACQSTSVELRSVAATPPLDYAVLVTGGAFLTADPGGAGTFAATADEPAAAAPAAEPIPMAGLLDVLRQGRVFRRADLEPDAALRQRVRDALRGGGGAPDLLQTLQSARDAGYDLLLVVEELQDGPIEAQGINGRWPVTFFTWILLGLGALIPDHTFESRATLRVTVRELQTGRVLHDPLLVGGPLELSLEERGSLLGILLSIVVPPFWIPDDEVATRAAVREVVARRLLLSLARDLKSDPVRQRLRERAVAGLSLAATPRGLAVQVDAAESLSVARLRAEAPALDPAAAEAFERVLLGSQRRDGERFRYEALLPPALARGRFQVLVGTIRGGVASATFAPEDAP